MTGIYETGLLSSNSFTNTQSFNIQILDLNMLGSIGIVNWSNVNGLFIKICFNGSNCVFSNLITPNSPIFYFTITGANVGKSMEVSFQIASGLSSQITYRIF